jgi:hypothetical protein
MKVFISWSGTVSHKVATIFRDWLPSVIQSIEPYVSSEDIDKGARWSTDIAGELNASSYGLVCLTKENLDAPWINFEAGALGKSIEKSRVSPFLFRLKRSDVEGPILQFQSTIFERDDVLKLLKSINAACTQDALEDARLEKAFDVWWPQLETQLTAIVDTPNIEPDEKATTAENGVSDKSARVLEEILELTRNNHKLLRDPTSLLPPDYIEHVIRRRPSRDHEPLGIRGFEGEIEPDAIRDVVERYRDALKFFARARPLLERHPEYMELYELMERLDAPLRYISSKMNMRIPKEPFNDKVQF